jgi:hypothetical protein
MIQVKENSFVLETENTTYVIGIRAEGILENLY